MANVWYYAKDGQQKGPVSGRELKRLAAEGLLRADDLVWREGLADWTPAGRIRGLLPVRSTPSHLVIEPLEAQHASSAENVGRPARPRRSQWGQILLMFSSLLFVGAFCTPWWEMTFTARNDTDGEGIWNHRLTYMRFPGMDLRTNREGTDSASATDRSADKGFWARKLSGVMTSLLQDDDAIEKAVEYAETRQASSNAKEKSARKEAISFLKLCKRNRQWWKQHLKKGDTSFVDRLEREAEKTDDAESLKLSLWIWGWSEFPALMGLIFGSVILVLAFIFLLIPVLRNWSWILSFFALAMGVIALVFSLIWIFQAPSDDLGNIFAQRLLVGPCLLLGGAGLFLLVGLLDFIFGLSFIIRNSRRRSYA